MNRELELQVGLSPLRRLSFKLLSFAGTVIFFTLLVRFINDPHVKMGASIGMIIVVVKALYDILLALWTSLKRPWKSKVPSKLYYFTSLEHGIAAAKQSCIKVGLAKDLNDPFELTPRVPDDQEDRPLRSLSEEEVRDQWQRHANLKGGVPVRSFEEYLKFQRELEKAASESVDAGSPTRGLGNNAWAAMWSRTIGIICFAENPLSELMWAHYAKKHGGCVLEIDTKNLPFKFLQVHYSTRRPIIRRGPITNLKQVWEGILRVVRTKSVAWSYEEEWRIVAPLPTCEVHKKGDAELYFFRFPPEAISGVLLGSRVSQKNADAATSDLKALNRPYLKLFQVFRHERDYRLECRPVS